MAIHLPFIGTKNTEATKPPEKKEQPKEQDNYTPRAQPRQSIFGGRFGFLLLLVIIILTLILGLIIGGSCLGGGIANDPYRGLVINPMLLVVIFVGVILVAIGVGILISLGFDKWKIPEKFLFAKIRLGHYILLRNTGMGGRESWIPARLSEDGVMLEVQTPTGWAPRAINPHILGMGKNSFFKGIEIVDTIANNLKPIGPVEAASNYYLQEHYKDPKHGYKILPFLDDGLIMYLYCCPAGELEEACALYVSVDPGSIKPEDLQLTPKGEKETLEDYKKRVQTAFNDVYVLRVNTELQAMKSEIVRLKDETKNHILPSMVYVRQAAGASMDSRYDIETYERQKKIIANKTGIKPPGTLIPDWIKWLIILAVVLVCLGLMIYLACTGIHMVVG